MSADLDAFAAYARKMVTAKHRIDCPNPRKCDGCVTEEHRVLWKRLADEARRGVSGARQG